MSFRANPPHSLIRSISDSFRKQAFIFLIIPFFKQLWMNRCEIIEADENCTICAKGTIRISARRHGGSPCMAHFASPPHRAIGTECDHLRSQRSVQVFCPLSGKRWILREKVIIANQNLFSGTNRASAASNAVGGRRFPMMSFCTMPPHFPVR